MHSKKYDYVGNAKACKPDAPTGRNAEAMRANGPKITPHKGESAVTPKYHG